MNRILGLGLAVVVFVAACGYKGPLVLPQAPAAEKESTEKLIKQKTP
ncbi:MAG: lipoprotein [Acidiferrobacterales bacterium]